MILKKNLAFIENEITKMQRVPERLFVDADNWVKAARSKLDKFEENIDKPNFINYDLLESKDPSDGPDIINFGETLVSELEEHKDISMGRVASQIKQLGLVFNKELINKLRDVVNCQVVDGVEIDEAELASMEEMMQEASAKNEPQAPAMSNSPRMGRNHSLLDAAPIGRSSMAVLAGDENDLLAETPVFS